MQSCIYATDMAKHMSIINDIKTIVEVPAAAAAFELLPEGLQEAQKKLRTKLALELVVHASDLSFLGRPTEVQKVWAYLLFDEFFH